MCSHVHATVLKCRGIRLPDSDITAYMYFYVEEIHHICHCTLCMASPWAAAVYLQLYQCFMSQLCIDNFSVWLLCNVFYTALLVTFHSMWLSNPGHFSSTYSLCSPTVWMHTHVCAAQCVSAQMCTPSSVMLIQCQTSVYNSQQGNHSTSPTRVDHTMCDPCG